MHHMILYILFFISYFYFLWQLYIISRVNDYVRTLSEITPRQNLFIIFYPFIRVL